MRLFIAVPVPAAVVGVDAPNDLAVLKEGYRIIHWVPDNCVPATVIMPTGERRDGFAEILPKEEEGKVVQFERFGFVKVEKVSPKLTAYFTH